MRACVSLFYQMFLCVCCLFSVALNSCTFYENRWILWCGTSKRLCPKPQTRGRTLQSSPQCKNTFSVTAFKPWHRWEATVSDVSVRADLHYKSIYSFCHRSSPAVTGSFWFSQSWALKGFTETNKVPRRGQTLINIHISHWHHDLYTAVKWQLKKITG